MNAEDKSLLAHSFLTIGMSLKLPTFATEVIAASRHEQRLARRPVADVQPREAIRPVSTDSVEKLGCCSGCDEVILSCREMEIAADDGTSAS